jgi:hypothetical protein
MKRPTKNKALLTLVFTGAIINSPSPALPNDNLDSHNSVVHSIVSNKQFRPEIRAYYLISLASKYLDGLDVQSSDGQFKNIGNLTFLDKECDKLVVHWAERASAEKHHYMFGSAPTQKKSETSPALSDESLELANSTLLQALIQLDKATDRFVRLNLLYIASLLFEKAGNTTEALKCAKILDESIEASEKNSSVDEAELKATASLLNSRAYGVLPMTFPDLNPEKNRYIAKTQSPPFTPSQLAESENLKLRAAAIADRLSSTSDERRKVHRDLALFYMHVGKPELADKQKKILFKLVGTEDDSILYAQSLACGQMVWWQSEIHSNLQFAGCGMG